MSEKTEKTMGESYNDVVEQIYESADSLPSIHAQVTAAGNIVIIELLHHISKQLDALSAELTKR